MINVFIPPRKEAYSFLRKQKIKKALAYGLKIITLLSWTSGVAISSELHATAEGNSLTIDKALPYKLSEHNIPSPFIALGGHAILVEKSTQKLYIYNKSFHLIKTINVTTGQHYGDKKKWGISKQTSPEMPAYV